MDRIFEIHVAGFKSIRDLCLNLKDLNIFIGPNGSGKSNIVSLFRMLSSMAAAPTGRLQEFVGQYGGASALLHDGPKKTPRIKIELNFKIEKIKKKIGYEFILGHAAKDRLILKDEHINKDWIRVSSKGRIYNYASISTIVSKVKLKNSYAESGYINSQERDTKAIFNFLRNMEVYQFHDTSFSSRIRNAWPLGDNRKLKEDGANLGSFILRMKKKYFEYYLKIVQTLRAIIPFFNDFELDPEDDSVLFRWSEKGTDKIFDASQASDGMLRVVALIALLAQPPSELPKLLIIDEPELGLHPYAISVVAGLIRSASRHIQVIAATQSLNFIDEFAPEDILVVERPDRETKIKRLDPKELEGWLKDYSLSELWEKNVIGGQP